jgi:hypothetical protein
MFEVSFRADMDVMSAMQDALKEAPRTTNTIMNRSILPEFTERARRELTPYPGAVKYPIRWKSERQRKAYFATNGFGGGIPSVRTGALGQAWNITNTLLENGGEIVIENTATTRTGDNLAQYVIGEYQQPFHRDTGWPNAEDKLIVLQEQLTDAAIDVYFSIVDAPPGTRFV